MYKMKNYEVEVRTKYEDKHRFNWILNACGANNAESFATDILAGMTHREISGADCDDPIGYDLAMRMFKIKARLIR